MSGTTTGTHPVAGPVGGATGGRDVHGPRRVPGRWRGTVRGWAASRGELQAAEDEARSRRSGGVPCGRLRGRRRVTLVGSLRRLTLSPYGAVPSLEAELHDGTGSVTLVWWGRRSVPGIVTGRWMRVEGLVTVRDGGAVLYNPRYELLGEDDA